MSENDELLHQISELQQQKQNFLSASQQLSMEFSSTQGEVTFLYLYSILGESKAFWGEPEQEWCNDL